MLRAASSFRRCLCAQRQRLFCSNKEPADVELEAKGETATPHHMHRSQLERKAYFLDTSVASLVLDGDLFHREPENITRYMSDVRFSCKSLEEVGEHKSVLKTVAAYNWAKKFVEGGGRLLLTPTVTTELLLAPQVTIELDTVCHRFCRILATGR